MFERACPQCRNIITYTDKWYYEECIRKNRVCRKCADSNGSKKRWADPTIRAKMIENNPRFSGKRHTNKTKQKFSKQRRGKNHPHYGEPVNERTSKAVADANRRRIWTSEQRHQLSLIQKGKSKSQQHRKNIRLATIAVLERTGGAQPRYNPAACRLIEAYGKQHGFHFQHAENGGEFHIKELGYWVDGYDAQQNVVIEVDEPYHRRQLEKDGLREKEIVEHLGCTFIRLKLQKVCKSVS